MKPFSSLLKSRRLWGLSGTALVLYLLVFVVFRNLDMSWIMPPTDKIAQALIEAWPRLPIFAVQTETVNGGKDREIYYTVPTRQFTPQELARMGATNSAMPPFPPK